MLAGELQAIQFTFTIAERGERRADETAVVAITIAQAQPTCRATGSNIDSERSEEIGTRARLSPTGAVVVPTRSEVIRVSGSY